MDMILNGEMCRKANHKMTGIGRFFCVQIGLIGLSVVLDTPTLLPPYHLAFIKFG